MNNVLTKLQIALSITSECLRIIEEWSSAMVTINSECSTQ